VKVTILTEGGSSCGYGHVSRCKALYQAFIERGITPELIINGDETIAHLLDDVPYMLRDWISDWTAVCGRVSDADISIVDSYLAAQEIYKNLSGSSRKAVYIDDTNRIDYPPGVLINGGFGWKELDYKDRKGTDYLVGPKYIFLRKEFWDVSPKLIRKSIGTITITLGGSNTVGFLKEIVSHFGRKYPKISKYIVLGTQFAHQIELKGIENGSTEVIMSPNGENMKRLMSNSDVLITGGGQTVLEALRMGLPPIVVGIAENQLPSVRTLEKIGVIRFAGIINDPDILNKLTAHLKDLRDNTIRREMSLLGQKLIDGKGGQRIVEELITNVSSDQVKRINEKSDEN
jgi:spore coat polysaccharide biosynthesis predicted glycosyltransferase SpsG